VDLPSVAQADLEQAGGEIAGPAPEPNEDGTDDTEDVRPPTVT
jgi:hypothetical protein